MPRTVTQEDHSFHFPIQAVAGLIALLSLVVIPSRGATLTLHPFSDGQGDKPFGSPNYVLITPAVTSYNATTFGNGEDHRALLEFSLFDLPAGALVSSTTFSYQVSGLTYNTSQFPRLAFSLFDGGSDSAIAASDLTGSTFGSAFSTPITNTGAYATSLSTSVFNGYTGSPGVANRLTSFVVGLRISQDVVGFQTQLYNSAYAIAHPSVIQPTLTLTYTVPEPSSMTCLGIGACFLAWRRRRS